MTDKRMPFVKMAILVFGKIFRATSINDKSSGCRSGSPPNQGGVHNIPAQTSCPESIHIPGKNIQHRQTPLPLPKAQNVRHHPLQFKLQWSTKWVSSICGNKGFFFIQDSGLIFFESRADIFQCHNCSVCQPFPAGPVFFKPPDVRRSSYLAVPLYSFSRSHIFFFSGQNRNPRWIPAGRDCFELPRYSGILTGDDTRLTQSSLRVATPMSAAL